MNARKIGLLLGLLATALAAFWPPVEEATGVVAPATRPRVAAPPLQPMSIVPKPASAATGNVRFQTEMIADLFPRQTWEPPRAQAVPAASADAAPAAPPPLPFSYVGKWREDGVETVFIAQGERVLGVQPGARIGDAYRVDQVGTQGVQLTYLPMNVQQTLRIEP